MTRRWWEDYPQRLEREYQALRDSGIPFEVDDDSFARGVGRITIHPRVDGIPYDIEVTFPDLYPFFRFAARARGLKLAHHQNPASGQLCLIGRATDEWSVDDTVADLITAQLPKLLRSVDAAPDVRAALEEHQGEPVSEYFPYAPHSSVLVDGSWVIDATISSGTLTLGFSEFVAGKPLQVLRAAVLRVQDSDGKELYALDDGIRNRYSGLQKVPWTRLNTVEVHTKAEPYFVSLEGNHRSADNPIHVQDGTLRVRAAVFPEEIGYNELGQGWLFAVQYTGWPKPKGGRPKGYYVARVQRFGRTDLTQRAPEMGPLAGKRVAQVGAGCIGAPSALEFARAGMEGLSLLDGDHVDAATTIRWPFGLPAAGQPKVEVLREFIEAHYPHTQVSAFNAYLGMTRHEGETPVDERELIARFTSGAALIYDASAEFGIQFFMSQIASEQCLPYVGVAGRQGGWGGYVVRIAPGITRGCWSCLQLSWGNYIDSPPQQTSKFVQPAGCGSPTFLAAGFDMTSLAMHGVRVAVGELCRGIAGGYPSSQWDVLVFATRDENGRTILPCARGYSLERHPDCTMCAQSTAA